MPFGQMLDSLPAGLFIGAHLLFLIVGLWAARTLARSGSVGVIWLYAVSQVVFLACFGGVITMKMAVLIEQTLMVILVAAIAMSAPRSTVKA